MQPTQLWLTVREAHNGSEWPPTLADSDWHVTLTSSVTVQGASNKPPYRTSPVFPVFASFASPDLANGTAYVSFFCFDPAFPTLGRLVESAPPNIAAGLLFSVGLASVIYVGRELEAVAEIERISGAKPRATEIWTVEDGRIAVVACTCEPPVALNDDLLTLQSYDALPPASRVAMDEFVTSIALVVPKIAAQMPTELPTFIHLVRLVNELLVEMIYVSAPMGVPPPTLAEYEAADFTSDPSLAETILYQNADRVIQINAALSYLTTQALSGAVPILERRSLIRRYSLLGVGTAVLALTRIARSIENAFAAGALESILSERADDALPLPGLDKLPGYDPVEWARFSVDRFADKTLRRAAYPKLPYFSGRLGFREGEYTISAALQSLAMGAGPEWSLLTLTHEMLHGHVRNILSLTFQANPARRPSAKWQEFYDRYSAHVNRRPPADESFSDSLRTVLLAYCCMTITHGSLTREADTRRILPDALQIGAEFWLPKADKLWIMLEGELRNISEILVHVLDLHYFYLSSLSAYVPLIWRSWSPLPQVKGDLRQYVLRTLLVIATKTGGTYYERFRLSRSRLVELLEPLTVDGSPGTMTIRTAVGLLRHDADSERLFLPFRASLIVADLASRVLTSKVVRGTLNSGDAHVGFRADGIGFEEWFEYDLQEGFVDDRVASPTAYLADRLARKLSIGGSSSLELETVQLFLACCSHLDLGGGPSAWK